MLYIHRYTKIYCTHTYTCPIGSVSVSLENPNTDLIVWAECLGAPIFTHGSSNSRVNSVWRRRPLEIIRARWGHKGRALVWWHLCPHKKKRHQSMCPPLIPLFFSLSLPLPAPRNSHKRSCEHTARCGHLQTKRKRPQDATYISGTLILDFSAPDVRNAYVLFKPPGLRYIVMVARAD